ncbi:uncharacterized protein RJT21DRAFT_4325 [Scheffersomyces amazonensis]|uniref:uncharacterized protein n=1 Tax=Scheffersomyces amazonensis TaxID=1078765 RepID=UPI00315C8432
MSKATVNNITNLFIDKSKAPDNGDLGIMNLGKNCFFCQQLDFLPFQCEYCGETYCSNHRNVEIHKCKGIDKFRNQSPPRSPSPTNSNSLPSSKTLFPDRQAHKRQLDASLIESQNKPRTLLQETQFRVGDVAKKTPNAFKKLQKFLQFQKTKTLKSSSSNKIVDLSLLKKSAKGDTKIPTADKVYVWCLFLNYNEDQFNKVNVDKDRKPLYVSKNWVIGRALDSIANELHIPNINNSTSNINEKLNIFKLDDKGEPILVKNNLK